MSTVTPDEWELNESKLCWFWSSSAESCISRAKSLYLGFKPPTTVTLTGP